MRSSQRLLTDCCVARRRQRRRHCSCIITLKWDYQQLLDNERRFQTSQTYQSFIALNRLEKNSPQGFDLLRALTAGAMYLDLDQTPRTIGDSRRTINSSMP